MDAPSPARLFAALAGGTLFAFGIVGFFYSASLGSPGEVGEAFGLLSVNAWVNLLHALTGALGLYMAGYASRQYALWLGGFYLAVALWGFAIGSGEAVLGFLPVDTAGNLLHLLVGALGIGAALATPAARKGKPVTS